MLRSLSSPAIGKSRGTIAPASLLLLCICKNFGPLDSAQTATRLKLKKDVPLQLPLSFEEEACGIRNKLLPWRLSNFHRIEADESKLRHLEPRLAQIGVSLYSVSGDSDFKARFVDYLTQYDKTERLERPTALVVEALLCMPENNPLVSDVTARVNLMCESRGDEPMKPKRVGLILHGLGVKTKRTRQGYRVMRENAPRLFSLGVCLADE